jgi:hypothetical protein
MFNRILDASIGGQLLVAFIQVILVVHAYSNRTKIAYFPTETGINSGFTKLITKLLFSLGRDNINISVAIVP